MKKLTFIIFALFFFINILIPAHSYGANLKPSEIDMEKMFKETGIPVAEIKYHLGDTTIATVEDAIAVFTMPSSSPQEKTLALEKWIELSTTTKEIRTALANINKKSPLYDKALRKWIKVVSTAKEAYEVWEFMPKYSVEKQTALEKLATFYKK